MNTLTTMSFVNLDSQAFIKRVLLAYLFLVLPLFDMLTGFLIGQSYLEAGTLASPSQIGRFIGLALLFIVTVKIKHSLFMVLAIAGILILETIVFFSHNDFAGLAIGYVAATRFIYMYLAYLCFVRLFGTDLKLLLSFLKYNIVLICGSVVLASFTDFANSTYGWGAGTKGFFASGNGLGIYVGVATAILAAVKKYRLYPDVPLYVFALSGYALVLLGTKTSFLMLILVLFSASWSGRSPFIYFVAIMSSSVLYLDELTDLLYGRYDIIIQRFTASETTWDFVLSYRNVYVDNAWAQFMAQDPGFLRFWFGGGSYMSFQNPKWVRAFDTLETDFFDVFYMYGLVGLICYTYFLFRLLRPFVQSLYLMLPAVLLCAHSVFAGHVLFNGFGATLMVLILALGTSFDSHRHIAEIAVRGRAGIANGSQK